MIAGDETRQQRAASAVDRRWRESADLGLLPCGVRFVIDDSVPADEVHARDASGKLVGKIVNIGSKT